MSLPVGLYETKAGSRVNITGRHAGEVHVYFDWVEENACCDCELNPYPDDGCLTWSCDYCGGGSSRLFLVSKGEAA